MKRVFTTAILLAGLTYAGPASAVRLKELVDVEGFRGNHLVGVGLVVGLAGTGDPAGSAVARQPLSTLLRNLGTNLDPSDIRARNVAVVTVTAELPAFARPGGRVDVTVSSLGAARSLQGGTLIATALKGADRLVYAVAQGPLTTSGYHFESQNTGSFHRKNHVTVGRIPRGALVEREVKQTLPEETVVLNLKPPDFTTAQRIKDAIDAGLGSPSASVRDPGVVEVKVGESWKSKVVGLVAKLEAIEATPDAPARVVIDERSGTIVLGGQVRLRPAAVAYGGLTVRVTERFGASQPNAFARGDTVVIPDTEIEVNEGSGDLAPIPEAPTLQDVASALNALKVKPRDLVAILQALKAAGALSAEIQTL